MSPLICHRATMRAWAAITDNSFASDRGLCDPGMPCRQHRSMAYPQRSDIMPRILNQLKARSGNARMIASKGRHRQIHLLPSLETLEGRALLAAGTLDTLFNGSGLVSSDFGRINAQLNLDAFDEQRVAVQPDGKVLIAATTATQADLSDSAVTLVRLNVDGSLDGTFGSGGIVTANFGAGFTSSGSGDVIVQPDGKIVVVGNAYQTVVTNASTSFGNYFAMLRYESNGTLDTTFGTGGKVTEIFPQKASESSSAAGINEWTAGAALQPDGNLVVAIYKYQIVNQSVYSLLLARFDTNGTLDQSFGTDNSGFVVSPNSWGSYFIPRDVALQTDGKIVVVGNFSATNSNTGEMGLARYNADGSIDTAFGNSQPGLDAISFSASSSGPGQYPGLAIQPDGKIVAAGYYQPGAQQFELVRTNTDGSLDTTFGDGGIVTNNASDAIHMFAAFDVGVQPDGKIVVGGRALVNQVLGFTLARYDTHGLLDTTFNGTGKVATPFGTNGAYGSSMVIDPNGKFVVGGYVNTGSDNPIAVARYLGDTVSDLAMVSASLTSDSQSVNITYTISGSDLALPGTVDFYWATGPTLAAKLETTPVKTVPTATAAQATAYTASTSIASLGIRPPNATYILAVADSPSADPAHQVVSATVPPSVSWTNFDWNTDPDGTATNAGHRGLDFSYIVNGSIPANTAIPINFYWATGAAVGDIITLPGKQPGLASFIDNVNISTMQGNHGHGTSDSFQAGNDPAQWGTPPPNATCILAIIDPKNLLNELDVPSVSNRRLDFVGLPDSISEVLKDSVHPVKDTNGVTMTVTFNPVDGNGIPIPLSEAEVYLGIDHFNWIQTFQGPANVTTYLVANLDNHRPLIYTVSGIRYENADGSPDNQTPLAQSLLQGPLLDPVVQNSLTGYLTYVDVIRVGNNIYTEAIDPSESDPYNYILDELPDQGIITIGGTEYATLTDVTASTTNTTLMFYDTPGFTVSISPYGAGGYSSFETQLVGVNYDTSSYATYDGNGYQVRFSWRSNNVFADGQSVGGGVSDPVLEANRHNHPPVVSGGISGVQLDDGPGAKPSSTLSPPNPVFLADQTIILGQTLTFGLKSPGSFDSSGDTHSYSIAGSLAGASVDPDTGVFVFQPTTVGMFPVTFVEHFNAGRSSASQTINITVLPSASAIPPTLVVGPSGNATSGQTFTRTGSFQDGNAIGPFTATVDYGDGSQIQPLALNGDATFTLSHRYTSIGIHTITVRVTDANGLTGSSQVTVTVTEASSGLGAVPDAFVTTLYREVLGRFPEPAGLRFWAGKFVAHVQRPRIVRAFFASPERRLLVKQGLASKIAPHRVLADAKRAADHTNPI